MALEYAKLKENTYIVCLFPSAYDDSPTYDNAIVTEAVLRKYGDIVYQKDVSLTQKGALEFIRVIYYKEGWVGNYQNNFRQGHVKTTLCFPPNTFGKAPLKIYLYECAEQKMIIKAKKEVRDLLQIGHDSIHINDTHDQTMRIARTVFNNNSIEFINHRKHLHCPNFENLMHLYQEYLEKNQMDSDRICIDASAILSAYGLRDCRDLDLLHWGKIAKDPTHMIDSHNGYLKYHTRSLDEIVFNPNMHFYHLGYKFLEPTLLKKMKINRGEQKDFRDAQLIDSI